MQGHKILINASQKNMCLTAPHGLRVFAWIIDAAIVAIIFAFIPQPVYFLLLFAILIVYHTLMVWLVHQTIGKALFGLRVERIGEKIGFFWSLGRASLGYFIIDLLGVGIIVALFNRRHRCPHDYVFGSVVRFQGPAFMKANNALDRIVSFAGRQAKAFKEKKKTIAILGALWAFLEAIGNSLKDAINFLSRLGSGTQSIVSAPSIVEALSMKAAVLITLATTGITAAAVAYVPMVSDTANWLIQPHYFFVNTSEIFTNDKYVIANFQFNGNVNDSSANKRHARLLGGEFIKTPLGRGLRVSGSNPVGLDWSKYANLLRHPYTIEIVLTPRSTAPWGKIFGFDDKNDKGWYYKSNGIQAYPNLVVGSGKVKGNLPQYIAFVSTAPSAVDVYFQGKKLGSTQASFEAPPQQAIFFHDDSETDRHEQIDAVVEEMRISRVARTPSDIAAVQKRLETLIH